jgi:putative colanic acid biosynthesis glycosyltransferase
MEMKNSHNYPLSIITIVLNDIEGFKKTLNSIKNQDRSLFEYIVIDGGSTDGTLGVIESNRDIINRYVSEPDQGIYDAYNKGAKLAEGASLLYMNAGDYFVGKVIYESMFSCPILLPVKYVNRFERLVNYRQRHYRYSHPYNLQGIIFENKDIRFNTEYKIASDYDYYLQHGYGNLDITKTEGYVLYDNNGISTIRYQQKYAECGQIVFDNFGWFNYFTYLARTKIKHYIKVLLRLINK